MAQTCHKKMQHCVSSTISRYLKNPWSTNNENPAKLYQLAIDNCTCFWWRCLVDFESDLIWYLWVWCLWRSNFAHCNGPDLHNLGPSWLIAVSCFLWVSGKYRSPNGNSRGLIVGQNQVWPNPLFLLIHILSDIWVLRTTICSTDIQTEIISLGKTNYDRIHLDCWAHFLLIFCSAFASINSQLLVQLYLITRT